MSVKTWDLLDREDGYVYGRLRGESPDSWTWKETATRADALAEDEVAYCRETGEVVYR